MTLRIWVSVSLLMAAASAAEAAPCLMVTVTGAQGGPQAYQGQAGPGTLVRFGDDANNCNAVRMQFDVGRSTILRLSQVGIQSAQMNAVFLTHLHNDHSEGLAELLQHRWMIFPASPKIDVVCSDDAATPLGFTMSCRKFISRTAPFRPAKLLSASPKTSNAMRLDPRQRPTS